MSRTDDREASPTIEGALHVAVDGPFEEVVDRVQIEHELAGFETIATNRLDELVRGVLGDEVERAALVVMCHPEVARDALTIDPGLAAMLPCTTAVYERPDDDLVHVRHVSATKAMRDLGAAPGQADDLADLVELTGERMTEVWAHVEDLADD